MSSFLFVTWEGGGNVSPALVAASGLLRRGHDVRFLSDECNRPEAEAVGLTFTSWQTAPNRHNRHRDSQTCRDWAAPTPQEGLQWVVRDTWCGPALQYAQDVIAELRRQPADLVVTCEALFGVMAGCESIGQNFVLLCPNVSLAPLPGIPPLGPGLEPPRNAEEVAMHAQIQAAVQGLIDSGLPQLNEARAALGLQPLQHVFDQYQRASRELLATGQAFDFPAESLPERIRYVGPLLSDPHWAQPWTSPWPSHDPRPLVAVGFSTTFQNHAGVVQCVIDALADLPVRVLVTLGGSLEPDELQAAANTVLVESAPHGQLMQEAALVVTHGGHGTVMRALLARKPQLVIPHGRDQNDNAVRVTARGAGLSLPATATAEEMRLACQRLLDEQSFTAAARQLGDRIAEEVKASRVLEELEEAACLLLEPSK